MHYVIKAMLEGKLRILHSTLPAWPQVLEGCYKQGVEFLPIAMGRCGKIIFFVAIYVPGYFRLLVR